MRIAYDLAVDALRVIFQETTVTTKEVAEGIAVDYDVNGIVAGIEVLDAQERFGDASALRRVTLMAWEHWRKLHNAVHLRPCIEEPL